MTLHSAAPEPILKADAARRARRVKMVLMDVDGTLTDGRIVFSSAEGESKFFSAQDGVGIRLAERAGLLCGVITGRKSEALHRRATELGITEIHQRSLRKTEAYDALRARRRMAHEEIAFLGDDLVDLPVMKQAGFAATVPDAVPEVIRHSHFVSSRAGGLGGVREILDFILKVQGRWFRVTGRYL
jgi:3-deoxy-D-manno-octulosonate 8-phosphate phosphatase (KDO 8-P phosphatase)